MGSRFLGYFLLAVYPNQIFKKVEDSTGLGKARFGKMVFGNPADEA
jgi:hypothetical protein